MTTKAELRYPYQPSWMPILFGGLFFSACSGILAYTAWTNDRGLIVNGFLEMETRAATVVYWALAGFSLVLVLLCALQAYIRMTQFREVRLTEDLFIAPKSAWSTQEVAIPLVEISEFKQQEVNGQQFLKVATADGKKVTLVAGYLPNRQDFQRLVGALGNAAHNVA